MRIAVTGRRGQVVRSLSERGPMREHEIVALGRPDLDLTAQPADIADALEGVRPNVVVSAAAYTAVDKAESEPELAFAVNERGAGAVAEAARRQGVPLIHLSTDYVFAGDKASPYREEDPTATTGVYGASKLAGEKAVMEAHDNVVVLRTAWVYSPFGANFVKTMLTLAGECDELRVVADQRGNPTSALDIADGVLSVAENLIREEDRAFRGVFHMSAAGEASWAEFASAVFEASAKMGGASARVEPIASADYPTSARRPANSRLDSSKLEHIHGVRLPDWRAALEPVVIRLLAGG